LRALWFDEKARRSSGTLFPNGSFAPALSTFIEGGNQMTKQSLPTILLLALIFLLSFVKEAM